MKRKKISLTRMSGAKNWLKATYIQEKNTKSVNNAVSSIHFSKMNARNVDTSFQKQEDFIRISTQIIMLFTFGTCSTPTTLSRLSIHLMITCSNTTSAQSATCTRRLRRLYHKRTRSVCFQSPTSNSWTYTTSSTKHLKLFSLTTQSLRKCSTQLLNRKQVKNTNRRF